MTQLFNAENQLLPVTMEISALGNIGGIRGTRTVRVDQDLAPEPCYKGERNAHRALITRSTLLFAKQNVCFKRIARNLEIDLETIGI